MDRLRLHPLLQGHPLLPPLLPTPQHVSLPRRCLNFLVPPSPLLPLVPTILPLVPTLLPLAPLLLHLTLRRIPPHSPIRLVSHSLHPK